MATSQNTQDTRLAAKKIAFLVGPGFEDLEFWVPYMRLKEEGAALTIVGEKAGESYASKSGGVKARTDAAAADLSAEQFDAVVIPGGWCPDKIRRIKAITDLVQAIYQQGKIVGMICHAGQVGISARIVQGHEATGSDAIKDDLENAGAKWVDKPAFRSGNIVWGRVVEDIPDFCRELVRAIEQP